MEQYTSEQALNGILNILSTVVDDYQRSREQSAKQQDSSDIIAQLLGGVSAAASKDVGLGQQIESLSNGMKTLKESGVTESDVRLVADMVSSLGAAIHNLELSEVNMASMVSLSQALSLLGSYDGEIIENINRLATIDHNGLELTIEQLNNLSQIDGAGLKNALDSITKFSEIDKNVIKNIEALTDVINIDTGNIIREFVQSVGSTDVEIENVQNIAKVINMLGSIDKDSIAGLKKLSKLDPSLAQNLIEFMKNLDFSDMPELNSREVQKNISALSSLLRSVTSIIDNEIGPFRMMMLPWRGKQMGRAIGKFFDAMVKNIPQEKIQIQMQGVAEMLNTMMPFISDDSKVSVGKMQRVLNEKTGANIGSFIRAILDAIPSDENNAIAKNRQIAMNGLIQFLKQISEFGLGDYIKMQKILTAENGKNIGDFIKNIADGTKDIEADGKKLQAISQFIKDLSSIGISGVLTIVAMSKFAQGVNAFIKNLLDGIEDKELTKMKEFSEGVKSLSKAVMLLTASVLLLAGGMAVIGVETVLLSVAVTTAFVAATMLILKKLGDSKTEIETGTKALLNIAKAMTLLTLDVLLVAGIAMVVSLVDWESLAKVGVIMVALGGIVVAAMWASDKWNKQGENIMNMVKGVSLLMLASVAAVGIAAFIADNFTLGSIVLGIAVVAGVVLGSMWLINKMSELDDKQIDNAVRNMALMVGVYALIGLTAKYVIAPLIDVMEGVIAGSVVVGLVILGMMMMTKSLAKVDEKQLNAASKSFAVQLGMLLGVSLIAIFIMPNIADNLKNVTIGAVVVLAVIGIMMLMTKMVSSIDEDKLKQANNTLLVLTAMFAVVGIVSAFVLPEIGRNWKDAAIGGVVVLAIVGLMVGMTWLVSKVKEEALVATYKTLGVLTAMLVAVSLVARFLLPEIGKNWADAALGGVVVLGIIALMTGIVALVSMIDNEALKQTYITMGVLTVMLVAVSLIAMYILPEIGKQWKDAAAGAIVVLGIVGIMGLMVWGLSSIKESKLKWGLISMAAMTFVLLGISLIVSELLIPIGYEWDSAAIGGAVVLGVIGLMGLITFGLSKIPKKNVIAGISLLAAIAGVLFAVSEIVENYFIPIGAEAEAAINGGMVVVGTIGVMGLIIAAAGQLSMGTIAKGALAVGAISGLLWLMSQALDPYIDLCIKMYENDKATAIGGLEIVATLTAWGLIMVAVGALMTYGAAFLAMGAAAITGIAGVLFLISQMLPDYIDMCVKMSENAKAVKKGSEAIAMLIGEFGVLMGGIGAMLMIPFVGIALVSGAAAMTTIAGVIYAISHALNPFIDVMVKMKDNNINESAIRKFTKIMIGNGIDDKESPSLIASITNITEALSEIGAWTALKAKFIATSIRPIFETIGMFIDIIGRICNMKYVSEWNEDGTPAAYETISLAMFREAGNTVSVTFGVFLEELGKGLHAIKDVSGRTILLLAAGIGPVMNSIKNFTDAILSVLSAKIPEEYDENGKPIKWSKFSSEDFAIAATMISDSFMTFLEKFSEKSKNITVRSAMIISMMKEGIEPVMNAVSTWTKTVMDFVAGREVEYTDVKTGKTVKEVFHINPEEFAKHGETIADTFIGFIDGLWNKFNAYGYTEHHYKVESHALKSDTVTDDAVEKNHVTDLITGFANIGEIMGAVETFVNLIFNVAEKVGKIDLKAQGQLIGEVFTGFVNTLCDTFVETTELSVGGLKFEDTHVGKKLTLTIDGLGKVKKMTTEFSGVLGKLLELINKYDGKMTTEQIDGLYGIMTYFVKDENLAAIQSLGTYELNKTIEFMKNMNKISETIKKVGNNLEDLEHIKKSCITMVECMQIFDDKRLVIKNIDDEDIKKALPFMKITNRIAEYLKELQDVMNDIEMTEAVLKFVQNIELLTENKVAERAARSRQSLVKFYTDLKQFTVIVHKSEKQFIKFSKSVDKTREALNNLDNVIIEKERKRNESLDKFANMIQKIADAVNDLREQIESLDENKILRNFDTIRELIETARSMDRRNSVDDSNRTNQTTPDTSRTQTKGAQRTQNLFGTQDQRRNGSDISVAIPAPVKQLVTFTFANTSFTGTMETRNI